MLKTYKYLIYFILFGFFIGCSKISIGDNTEEKILVDRSLKTTRYYASFIGYNHPVKLIDEISYSEAENKKSYYIAIYQDDELFSVSKIFNDKQIFEYKYYYKDSSLSRVVIEKEDGSEFSLSYD